MLVSVVVSQRLPGSGKLSAALAAAGATVAYVSTRDRGEAEILSDIREAARTGAEVLVVDIGASPGPALVEAVRAWRIARPRGRVLLLAPGREPPDTTVSRLVDLGVYDILTDEPEDGDWSQLIAAALESTATYADAARWHLSPAAPATAAVADTGRVLSPVIVPVAAPPGQGATLVSLLAADYLARHGQRVAVVEACRAPVLLSEHAKILNDGIIRLRTYPKSGYRSIGRVHLYAPPPNRPEPIAEGLEILRKVMLSRRYRYIVVDFGRALDVQAVRDEVCRAGICLLVVPAALWRRERTISCLVDASSVDAMMRVIISPATEPGELPEFLDRLGLRNKSIICLPPVPISEYLPQPSPQSDAALAEALAPVFAPAAPRRRGFLRWLRR